MELEDEPHSAIIARREYIEQQRRGLFNADGIQGQCIRVVIRESVFVEYITAIDDDATDSISIPVAGRRYISSPQAQ